jgi:hypothetical protein
MAIVDRYGNLASFVHSARQDRTKGVTFPTPTSDMDKLVGPMDAATLRSLSKRLYMNMGVPRCAIGQIADFSIGEAWIPSYVGESDFADGKQIASFMSKVWFPNCDVRGECNWWELLALTIKTTLHSGGAFWALVKGADSFPRIQMIPAHRCGNGRTTGNKVVGGKWDGYRITDGFITYTSGKVAAYRVLTGDNMETFTDIDAADMIHIPYDQDFVDQTRTLPAFSHAIANLASVLASNEDERTRMQIISRLYLTVFSETGGMDEDEMRRSMSRDTTDPDDTGVTYKDMGGGITYMTAGSGEKMEQMTHQNPSETYNNYIDRMIRDALVGIKWPMALVWQATGQGTAERLEIVKARRTITATQRRIRKAALRAFAWAYSVFQEAGRVPLLDHPFSWSFSKPPRLSVDDGRESKMELEEWRAGVRNTDEILEARGMTTDEFDMKRAWIIAKRKIISRQVSEEASAMSGYEIEIEDREMAMLTPNEVAEKEKPEPPDENQPSKPNEDSKD